MTIRTHITAFIATLLLAMTTGTYAASVTYVLDQSNVLPDNVDYLTVTISDDVEGQLDFWIDIQSPLADIAGENFGIQKFAFNISSDIWTGEYRPHRGRDAEPHGRDSHARWQREDWRGPRDQEGPWHPEWNHEQRDRPEPAEAWCRLDRLLTSGDFVLPDGWEVQLDQGRPRGDDGFGVRLLGNGNNRQDPLHFSVLGLTLEDVIAGFSVHVAGFEYLVGDCVRGEGEHERAFGCDRITSAYFFGAEPVVVPLPAAVWLFGSGLLGLTGIARRRSRLT